MAIEKINGLNPINLKVPFKGSAEEKVKPAEADSEKSNAMKYMVGLGAAAALVIGGIMYVRRGKAPKGSEKVIEAATSSSTTHSGSSTSAGVEKVKSFMKKLEDGTEYLFRTEERDKDGNLVKSVRYAKDGKTVERIREFKLIPADGAYPARNVVASEIRYGKNGEILYQSKLRDDYSGFEVIERPQNARYVLEASFDFVNGEGRIYSDKVATVFRDVDTNNKLIEVAHAKEREKGIDYTIRDFDLFNVAQVKFFDKKTGTKCVKHVQALFDGGKKEKVYGEGASYIETVTSPKGNVKYEKRFNSKGECVKLKQRQSDGSYVISVFRKNGDKLDFAENGKLIEKDYQTKDAVFTQRYKEDENGLRIETFMNGSDTPMSITTLSPQKKHESFWGGRKIELFYDENGRKLKRVEDLGTKAEPHIYEMRYYPNGNPKVRISDDGRFKRYFDVNNPKNNLTITRSADGRITCVERSALPNREGKKIVYGPTQLGWTDVKEGQKAIGYYGYNPIGRAPRSVDVYENGRLIQKGNSQITYLDDGKIVEENLREDYKFVYQNDFEHPIERYSREYDRENGYHWVKMPLEI